MHGKLLKGFRAVPLPADTPTVSMSTCAAPYEYLLPTSASSTLFHSWAIIWPTIDIGLWSILVVNSLKLYLAADENQHLV
jgi:hypothetical protein